MISVSLTTRKALNSVPVGCQEQAIGAGKREGRHPASHRLSSQRLLVEDGEGGRDVVIAEMEEAFAILGGGRANLHACAA